MAIGYTGSVQTTDPWGVYDPNAVERDPSVYPRQIDESTRRQVAFEYTPVTSAGAPNQYDDLMRQVFERSMQGPPPQQPRGPTPYWENPETYYPQQQQVDPIAQSKAATAAAYKYIAFRGYQQELKNGASAADAFAKWGPMLVADASFGPAMKAIRPEPQATWMPADPATGRPGSWVGGKVTIPDEAAKFQQANPLTGEPAGWRSGGRFQQVRPPATPKLNAVDQSALDEAERAEREGNRDLRKATTPEERQVALGMINWGRSQRNTIAKRNGLAQIPTPKPPVQPLGETAASPLPSANEVPRMTKDGKIAIYDKDTKKFIRYAE